MPDCNWQAIMMHTLRKRDARGCAMDSRTRMAMNDLPDQALISVKEPWPFGVLMEVQVSAGTSRQALP